MVVKCIKGCWDSKRCRRYYPGDQDDVDPLEPLAMYFEFPPGTTVYCKKKGVEGTMAVPGLNEVPENEELCPICKTYKGTAKQVNMHKIACIKKILPDPAMQAAL